MGLDFSAVADDYFVNLNLQTALTLPNSRETILHFCEAVQKEFGDMSSFYQRDDGDSVLEGDRESGSYRWLELGPNRLTAGHFNPPGTDEANRFHYWLLDRSVYFLGLSALDVDALDVLMGFNLDFRGNRNEVVAQALLSGSPLSALGSEHGARSVECDPTLVVALEEDCYLQARLAVEARCNSYQVRTGQYDDEPISVFFTVRRYPQPGRKMDLKAAFAQQCETCEDLISRVVVPQIVLPISAAIASHGL